MVELGQLERHHEEFSQRNVRVLVVSLESREEGEKTQAQFPHLKVVADADHHLIDAVGALQVGAGDHFTDTAAPTTILIDRSGVVRWAFRPTRFVTRLSAVELLAAVDQHLPK